MELSSEQAYKSMFMFLDRIFEQTQSADLGDLLSSMQFLQDGSSSDPAMDHIWLRITNDKNSSVIYAFKNMDAFVRDWFRIPDSYDVHIRKLLADLRTDNDRAVCNVSWNSWLDCVKIPDDVKNKALKLN